MNPSSESSAATAPLRRRVLGSFLSALVGWAALNLFVAGSLIVGGNATRGQWVGASFVAVYSAALVFGTWLLALLPLYLVVPPHSPLWRWPICTCCGALAGAAIMFAFSGRPPHDDILLAAITAGITCLFGSLTAHRFQYEQSA